MLNAIALVTGEGVLVAQVVVHDVGADKGDSIAGRAALAQSAVVVHVCGAVVEGRVGAIVGVFATAAIMFVTVAVENMV